MRCDGVAHPAIHRGRCAFHCPLSPQVATFNQLWMEPQAQIIASVLIDCALIEDRRCRCRLALRSLHDPNFRHHTFVSSFPMPGLTSIKFKSVAPAFCRRIDGVCFHQAGPLVSPMQITLTSETSRPNLQTEIRRFRSSRRSEHSDPTDARTISVRSNEHHTAYIYRVVRFS